VSSISSSRRGRENDDRNENYFEIRADFSQLIGDWQEQMGQPRTFMTAADYARQRMRQLAQDADEFRDTFSLTITPLTDAPETTIVLDESLRIPAGTKVRREQPMIFAWSLSCDTQSRYVTSDKWCRFDGAAESIDILQQPELSEDEIRAEMKERQQREIERQRILNEPPPPPPRRAPVAAEANVNVTGFIPGANLGFPLVAEGDISIREYDPYPGNIEPDNGLFGTLTFHLSTPLAVAAVAANITGSVMSGRMPIAVYDSTGKRLFQVRIHTDGGPASVVLKNPVTLTPGCYKLAWAPPTASLHVWSFRIGREERDLLNSGGGCVIVGMGKGREGYQLPAKLTEVSEPPERMGLVPMVLLKG